MQAAIYCNNKICCTTVCSVHVLYPRHVISLLSISQCLLLSRHKRKKMAILS